jgi:hypothetical protein
VRYQDFNNFDGGFRDNDWFAFLSQQPGIDEVNFWQPHATG